MLGIKSTRAALVVALCVLVLHHFAFVCDLPETHLSETVAHRAHVTLPIVTSSTRGNSLISARHPPPVIPFGPRSQPAGFHPVFQSYPPVPDYNSQTGTLQVPVYPGSATGPYGEPASFVGGLLGSIGHGMFGWPPFDAAERGARGMHYRANWVDIENTRWQIDEPGIGIPPLAAIKRMLNNSWMHLHGDSTTRQIYNAFIALLVGGGEHGIGKDVTDPKVLSSITMQEWAPKRDICYGAFEGRRRELHFEENLCHCRAFLVSAKKIFTVAADGFNGTLTWAWKESMFSELDKHLYHGKPEKVEWNKIDYEFHIEKLNHSVGLYDFFSKHGKPDILIVNAGAHAFHLNNLGPKQPIVQDGKHMPVELVEAYANQTSEFVRFMAPLYLDNDLTTNAASARCMLWRTSNVPLQPPRCPPTSVLQQRLNQFTVPAMLNAGFHVVDVERIMQSSLTRAHAPARATKEDPNAEMDSYFCDQHFAPVGAFTELLMAAVWHGCKDKLPAARDTTSGVLADLDSSTWPVVSSLLMVPGIPSMVDFSWNASAYKPPRIKPK